MKRNLLRAAMVAVVIRGSGALAASTTLVSTNDYYYTAQRSTNIAGRVMGENGDYSLVRYEDAAWITEAWYERYALAADVRQTNAWTFAALVRSEPWNWWGEQTESYWSEATLGNCVVAARYVNNVKRILAAASNGKMTNRVVKLDGWARGKLVTKQKVMDAYAQLKDMKVVVREGNTVETNAADYVAVWKETTWTNNVFEWTTGIMTNISKIGELQMYRSGYGRRKKSKEYEYDEEEESWKEKEKSEDVYWQKEEVTGKGKTKVKFRVFDKEGWLRGWSSPRVVEAIRAWGVVWMEAEWSDVYDMIGFEEGEYYRMNMWDERGSTNMTYLVDLGEPIWKEAVTEQGSDYLVYELEVKPGKLLETCANMGEGMIEPAEVDEVATGPEVEVAMGEREVEKKISGNVGMVLLVIRLKPVTSLPGW